MHTKIVQTYMYIKHISISIYIYYVFVFGVEIFLESFVAALLKFKTINIRNYLFCTFQNCMYVIIQHSPEYIQGISNFKTLLEDQRELK